MATKRGLSVRIIAFAAFSAVCYFGATVIITVVLAILTAYLLDPFVNLLRRIRFPRAVAIAVSMAVAGLIVVALLSLLVETTQQFSENLPKYGSRIQRISNDIWNRVRAIEQKSEDLGKTIMPKAGRQPQAVQIQQPSTWHGFFFRDLGPVYDYLIQITFFPFLVYFLLAEKDRIRAFISQFVRSQTSLSSTLVLDTSEKIVMDVNSKVRGFILGTLLSTGIIFIVVWMLFLSFGVEGAVVWAILFSLLNILPFVGAILSAIPPLLISIVQFTSVQQSILLIGLCMGVHLIYTNWLIPRTTGPRTELSPLVVVLAMMYWGFLWGAIGIFLAVPLTASLRSIWMQYRSLEAADV